MLRTPSVHFIKQGNFSNDDLDKQNDTSDGVGWRACVNRVGQCEELSIIFTRGHSHFFGRPVPIEQFETLVQQG